MKRTIAGATGAMLIALSLAPTTAHAAPTQGDPQLGTSKKNDDRSHPLGDKQRALREKGVEKVVKGTAKVETNKKGKKVIKVAKGQYVNYDVNREEDIFTILAEFGTQTYPTTGGGAGPLHNQIPQPDRSQDNSTIWRANFDRAHYQNLMFGDGESFKDFYLKQSNGRFLAKGDVSDWVKVPYNEARYGSNKISDAAGAWPFVQDSANAWYAAQKAAGKTDAEIAAYLKGFDKVDRYDFDQDGDFNEPDGYIDHFQAIHAGEGEEAGGGAQGEDAIWSHRWYAYSNDAGKSGPATNKAGGVRIGSSDIWIGDYTTEPENGGLGVFTHEFGHDLGLPDLYDTQGGDNGTGFWTLMSAGSWLNDGTVDIGSKPGYMGPWEKLQLGWLDYQTVSYGKDGNVKLGPAALAGKMPQAALVSLPDKTRTTQLVAPHSGSKQWWSGAADDLNVTLTRPIDLTTAKTASLSAWVNYQTEAEYDYFYAEVTDDGGATWKQLATYDGSSGGYVQKTYDLSAYAGKQISFRFRYASDGGVHGLGAFVDDIMVTADGQSVFNDDVEGDAKGWTAKGFTQVGASSSEAVTHYYLAENRTYTGYDRYLKTGPYNFGWANTRPDWVERFPYQDGMLVWYINNEYTDNNTSVHPGGGQVLPVDARPTPIRFPDGALLGNRRQPFDATFGLQATDPVTFHRNGVPVTVPSQPAIRTFDDSDPNRYWSAANPWSSTKVAGAGVKITVNNMAKQGDQMNIKVDYTK
ncbi:immune inhibitor A domain-containing protein [Arsenicicoccus bolidensis]|uniref:Immune inhibitor A n=1 Tax=Arsenicicoccus bolidensis TaxID=229480 RepID=A0ABS9Q6K7_9MICO|nr:immune inhibitor A domain-containing protein [Arsenicicoccus bolidensis]MCG7322738.1 immune inhibitor A [Arsenicicoccus bolidensis]